MPQYSDYKDTPARQGDRERMASPPKVTPNIEQKDVRDEAIAKLTKQVADLKIEVKRAKYWLGVNFDRWSVGNGSAYSWAWQIFQHDNVIDGNMGYSSVSDAEEAGQIALEKLINYEKDV